jgi:hypothetical protein
MNSPLLVEVKSSPPSENIYEFKYVNKRANPGERSVQKIPEERSLRQTPLGEGNLCFFQYATRNL